ncbi:MAG: hypothetical protein IJA59_10735 [Clostridia bacterium]|nr:hypothetical protein [Clostridia bacterium]
MINYAHRGASEYYPENTLSAFYAGIDMGADGIETDVRKTRDGVLVLFHDGDLMRVTGESGAIADYTFAELQQFTVKNAATGREDKIIDFETFLRLFGWRKLHFAIELKDAGIEEEAAQMMDRFGLCGKTIVTSFHFDNLRRMRKAAPAYKLGYLYKPDEMDLLGKAQEIHLEQLCPKAEIITPAMVADFKAMGYSVRAWGVKDEALMQRMIHCRVDGMTVNFPDKLHKALQE